MLEVPQLTAEQRKALEEKIKKMSPQELKELQKQQCIFCQIVVGKIPTKKILETDKIIAILDINPASKGHVLLLPKDHYVVMPQVPEDVLIDLFSISKKISQALLRGMKVAGTNLFIANGLVAGQRSQHFLIHLIPRREGDELFKMDEKLIDKEILSKVKSLVAKRFNEMMGLTTEIVDVEPVKEPLKKSTKRKKKENTTKTTSARKKEKLSEENNEPVNLDDIANLFK